MEPTAVADAIPQWIGSLSATALNGVLLYYTVCVLGPRMQEKFHDALSSERKERHEAAESDRRVYRDSIDKIADAHSEAITKILDRDERRAEAIHGKLDTISNKIRCQA